ncbi:hypothetical protein C7974DRAFT_420251 [Boeremia exigua]|uniref:uncharacterized protein n=1 Tax=Boeremia exigua TaxID=749465 RepID=UPI001E8CBCED|nr:uncharacterized protein C7974DRAFT_420251 [Boeremia exigua]KAH6644822.1 hypothetical protein C7974DRAFT_420251 [Boeremia exigua]
MAAPMPDRPQIPDYYFDLGIDQYATASEIKRAFRKLALEHHPDKKAPGHTIDAQEFRQARQAYDTLVDRDERASYDDMYDEVRFEWEVYREAIAEWDEEEDYRKREEERREHYEEEQRRAAEARQQRQQQKRQAERDRRQRRKDERAAAEAEKQRRAEEAVREQARRDEEAARAQRQYWEQKEREAEERSRKAAERQQAAQEAMARERLRQAKGQLAKKRSREAAERARVEQQRAAEARLRQQEIEEYEEALRREAESELARMRFREQMRKEKREEQRRKEELARARAERKAARKAAASRKREAEKQAMEEARRLREQQEAIRKLRAAQKEFSRQQALQERLTRVSMAKDHACMKHSEYVSSTSCVAGTTPSREGDLIDLGWTRIEGANTCDFCDLVVKQFVMQCPEGGAVACKTCLIRLSSHSTSPSKSHYDGAAKWQVVLVRKLTRKHAPRQMLLIQTSILGDSNLDAVSEMKRKKRRRGGKRKTKGTSKL